MSVMEDIFGQLKLKVQIEKIREEKIVVLHYGV